MAISNLVGVGLYSIPEAARLTGIPSSTISRWAFGYRRKHGDKMIAHSPIWNTQIDRENIKAIGFHDLLEVRFIAAFNKYGVSLQAIRSAASFARAQYNSEHPFTLRRFRTDGQSIFADVLNEGGFEDDHALLDLVKRQLAFRKVVGPALYAGIEYRSDGSASHWQPFGFEYIVLDPNRSFGRPIESTSGIPTETLYEAFLAEQSKSVVRRLYNISEKSLDAVIRFEQRLRSNEVLH